MAVSKMKKLSLIALKQDAESLTNRLIRLSCVEVTAEADAESAPDARADCDGEISSLSQTLTSVTGAIKTLTAADHGKKSLFPRRISIEFSEFEKNSTDYDRALEISSRVSKISQRLAEITAETAKIRTQIAALQPWLNYDLPLSDTETADTELMFGTLPVLAQVDEVVAAEVADDATPDCAMEKISEDKLRQYVVVLYSTDDDADMAPALAKYGFLKVDLSGFSQTAPEETERLARQALDIGEEAERLKTELTELSAELPKLKITSDILETRIAAAETRRKLSCTEETVLLSGWVPQKAIPAVEKDLSGFLCCYDLTDPAPEDDPPVLLVNKKNMDPFEMVLGLYSLPKYGAFDPTFIMSIFYFIIFGLMLADAGYGLILTVGCFAAIKAFDLHGGTKSLVKLFGICGISCMIAGVLFGSYFGNFIPTLQTNMLGIENPVNLAILFDPVEDPISFLILSLIVGAAHLLVGMGIKAYVLIRTGHPWAALFDVGSWFILFAGIGLIFVNQTAGFVTAGIGALMLVATQGRDKKGFFGKLFGGVLSLYDIVNYLADLLSYSRIMALGMSSAVIAMVINIIATLKGPTVVGWIMTIVVVLVGNVVNLAINLLGSFVHASRLQYIEFFGKFYEDGGRAFDPVVPASKYTAVRQIKD